MSYVYVDGSGGSTTSGVFEVSELIDASSTEAFLVRKDGDTGDVFTVDTTNSIVTTDGTLVVDVTDAAAMTVRKNASGGNIFVVDTSTPAVTVGNGSNTTNLILSKGVITLPQGTAAAPGYTWTGDTDTGMWHSAANTIGLTTNGSEKATVDTNGDLALTVNGRGMFSSFATQGAILAATVGNAPLLLRTNGAGAGITFSNDNGSTNFITAKSSGLTVGTALAGVDVTLANTASATSAVNFNNGTTNKGVISYNQSTDTMALSANATPIFTLTSTTATCEDKLIVDITDSAALLVRKNASGGNIFNIDTSTPAITIGNTTDGGNLTFSNGSAATSQIVFNDGVAQGVVSYNHSTDTMSFSATATPVLTLTSTTATCEDKLIVDITDAAALLVRKNASGGNIFNIDTSTPAITIGNTTDGGNLTFSNGSAATSQIVFNDGVAQGVVSYNHSTDTMSFSATATPVLTLTSTTATCEDKLIVDITDAAALTVRKNAVGANIFVVDTSTPAVNVGTTGTGTKMLITSNDSVAFDVQTTGSKPMLRVDCSGSGVIVGGGSQAATLTVIGSAAAAFAVQTTTGTALFNVNMTNGAVSIGNTTVAAGTLNLLGTAATSTMPINFNDGTTNKGVISYNLATDTMALSANATQILTLTSSTATLEDKLIIDITDTGALTVRKNASGGNIFNVDTSGNIITIGNNTNGGDIQINTIASTGVGNINFHNGTSALGNISYDNSVATGGQMLFKSNATTRMTLGSNGANFINPIQLPPFTVGTLPSASTAGRVMYVTDDGLGPTLAMADGSNWRRVSDLATVSTTNTTTVIKGLSSFQYSLTSAVTSTASGYIGDTNFAVTSNFNNGTAFGAINTTTGEITVNETGMYLIGYTVAASSLVGTNITMTSAINNTVSGLNYGLNLGGKSAAGSACQYTGSAIMSITAADHIRVAILLAGVPLTSYSIDNPHTRIWGYKISG